MSTALTVLSKPTSDPSRFEVYWAAGVHTQGVLLVDVLSSEFDRDVIAELTAAQHLLETIEVCSRDRTGNNLLITVSHGCIRKLAQGRSAKAHLAPYAMFLRTRFVEAEIAVSKDGGFVLEHRANASRSELRVTCARPSCVALPDGAPVGVTAHALERFAQKFSFSSLSAAWRELRSCAAHSATRASAPTLEEVREHGAAARAFDCYNGARLIVVDDGILPMIVTAYWHFRAQSNYQKSSQRAA